MQLRVLDNYLLNPRARPELSGCSRIAVEFLYFAIKEARACLFVGLFFAAVFSVPHEGIWGLPRYDALLVIALGIRAWMVWMVWTKLETVDEIKAILLISRGWLCT